MRRCERETPHGSKVNFVVDLVAQKFFLLESFAANSTSKFLLVLRVIKNIFLHVHLNAQINGMEVRPALIEVCVDSLGSFEVWAKGSMLKLLKEAEWF